MNEALKQEWIDNRGISVGKIALNPITLTDADMKKINEMEDAATVGSNPFMMAGRMTNDTADTMQTAADNSAGAMTGFMGMGMVGMGAKADSVRHRICSIWACSSDKRHRPTARSGRPGTG